MAGQTTIADIGIGLATNVKIAYGMSTVFGLGGIFYGLRQRTLRKENIKRTSPWQQRYEMSRDPNRSSSGLTPRGDTDPKDRQ